MKALVFSDSHGMTAQMADALAKNAGFMDAVLHLGDGFTDIIPFKAKYAVPFHQVAGNCDPYDVQCAEPPFKVVALGGKRVLMTHGHRYGARAGVDKLSYLAEEQRADICLYGHTHVPALCDMGGVRIMNPGSISRPRGGPYPSFGVIDITEEGRVHTNVVEIRAEGFRLLAGC